MPLPNISPPYPNRVAAFAKYESYESVKNWLLSVGESTRQSYRLYMRAFLETYDLSPDDLLELAQKDRKAAHYKLKEFYEKLKAEGLASKTRSVAYTSIRSFLSWNDLPLGKAPHSFVGRVQYEPYRMLEPQEVRTMISVARTRKDKALISFLAQSGQRVGIVSALRYRHVRHELDRGVSPVLVDVNGELLGLQGKNVNKNGVVYRFAIGRECSDLLRTMMEHRRRAGEPVNNDSWLFKTMVRWRKLDNGRAVIYRIKESEPGLPMSISGIRHTLLVASSKAGVDRVRPGPRIHGQRTQAHDVHPHIFRRWWKFRMRRGGVTDSDLLDYMLGHSNVRQQHGGSYNEFDPDYIRREYSKAEPFLTVLSNPISYGHGSLMERNIPRLPVPRATAVQMEQTILQSPSKGLQRVVNEWELDSYLSLGWRYIAVLPSGRIIVGS